MLAGNVLAVRVKASGGVEEEPRPGLVGALDAFIVQVALGLACVEVVRVVVDAPQGQEFLLSALEQFFLHPQLPLLAGQVLAVMDGLQEGSYLALVFIRSHLHSVSLPLPTVDAIQPIEHRKPQGSRDDLRKAARYFLVVRGEEIGAVAVVVRACAPVGVVIPVLVKDAVLVHLSIATTADYITQG